MNINIDVKQNENDTQVNIAGEIDVYSAPVLREKLVPLAEQGADLKFA